VQRDFVTPQTSRVTSSGFEKGKPVTFADFAMSIWVISAEIQHRELQIAIAAQGAASFE
jgi:hypothetical protein